MSKFAPPAPPMIAARWKGGSQVPGLIVIHSTVSATRAGAARATARYFATETTKTSAHYCVDSQEVVQCVGDHTVAYHCGYNADSIGIEMCDMPNAASLAHWLVPKAKRTGKKASFHGRRINPLRWIEPQHRSMLQLTARLTAQLCLSYGIPIRYLSDEQLRAWDRGGRTPALGGIVTHAQMSRVFKRSSHWDPGKWPSALFLKRTQLAARALRKAGS